MKLTILNILALLFVLQTLSYVKTVFHLQQPAAHSRAHHDQEDGHGHSHNHSGHEHNEATPSNDLAKHKHSPDEPAHSHAKDFWGIFSSTIALQTVPQDTSLKDHSYPDTATFFVESLQSRFSDRSLLRPPIRA